jgi:predicted  nucleic acid-binding Zn-ribbon protein
MKTWFRFLLPLGMITVVFYFFSGTGYCEGKPPSYSNDDIENYRNPSDNRPQEKGKAAISSKHDAGRKTRGKQDQEYWCKRATTIKEKIELAGRDVKEREEDISREQSKNVHTSRKMNTLQDRLKKAKDRLSSAERDLNDIEHEAHRKSIPPGWLRCQFD